MLLNEDDFKRAKESLVALGITPSLGGFHKVAPSGKKQKVDASMLFAGLGINQNDFIETYADKIKRSTSSNAVANAKSQFIDVQFVHPGFGELSSWSQADTEVFGRFKYAMNEMDGSFILLISMNEGHYATVPLSSKFTSTTISTISARCMEAEPSKPGKFKNLYEELTIGFNNRLQYIIDQWNADAFQTQEQFVEQLGRFIPHRMLKNLQLRIIGQQKSCGENENEITKILKPYSARLTSADGHKVEPLDFIAKYPDLLAGFECMHSKMPAIFSNSTEEPSLRYIDLDSIVEDGPCPTWDTYMKRYREDEANAFMAFIWGIFDAKNTGRQMLYIYDSKGFSGKSNVINCLNDMLGRDFCASIQKDSLNNQFSLAKIWDKRLVTISDNKNPKLLMSEKMHMMTGGDYAEIEMKGRNSFHSKLQTKVIASGNIPLEVHPDARHEISRLIVIRPVLSDELLKEFCLVGDDGNIVRRPNGDPVLIGDATFEENLKKEFKCFLMKCREVYKKMCPSRSEIIISDRMYDEILSNAPIETSFIADFFDQNFIQDDSSYITMSDISAKLAEFCKVNELTGKSALTISDFKEYVLKKFSNVVFGKVMKVNGRPVRCASGLKLVSCAVGEPLTTQPADLKLVEPHETMADFI